MIEIFGMSLGVVEVVTLLSFFSAIIVGYARLDNKLKNILDRNAKADQAHSSLDKKVDYVESMLRKEILDSQIAVDAKLSAQDERLRTNDVHTGRMEERFNFLQTQLTRILDILEKDKR